jgi:hypothetical protein
VLRILSDYHPPPQPCPSSLILSGADFRNKPPTYSGHCQNKKASCHFVTRPAQLILPLSPNHLCLAGAVIGYVYNFVTTLYANIVSIGRQGQVSWHPPILLRMNSKASGFKLFQQRNWPSSNASPLFSITQVEPF